MMLAVDLTTNKVVTRNATTGCSVLGHNTKFFENSVRYACCKLWNALPTEISNYVETKVNVCKRLNEWIINERQNMYTT
jgi:phage FluMu protein Com